MSSPSDLPSPPPTLDHRHPLTPFPRPRTSPLAIASFVCSLVLCVPFFTSLTGFALSFFAFRSIKKHHLSGRGFAIAGLWVGLAGILLWTSIAAFAVRSHQDIQAADQTIAQPFLRAVLSADYPTASSLAHPQFTLAGLQYLNAHAQKNYGTLQSLTRTNSVLKTSPRTLTLTYSATFSNSPATLTLTLTDTPTGLKVFHCNFNP